jgi:hypothetical protein
MFFRKKKALIDCDPKELDVERLNLLQSAIMARLVLVNNELLRRWQGMIEVAKGMDKEAEYRAVFGAAADRCEQINAILSVALAENLPPKSKVKS